MQQFADKTATPFVMEGKQDLCVWIHTHACKRLHTYRQRYTPAKLMRGKWLITSHLFHHWDTFRLISSHSHQHVDTTHSQAQSHFTHTLVCPRTQSVLHCLFMNSSVCCRQAGDEDIYSVLGHLFNIINLLSNLPSAFPTHLVLLYRPSLTYYKTVHQSQTSSD